MCVKITPGYLSILTNLPGIECKSTAFFAVLQINVIFCYIFLPKNLHISVIFCNFAPDFKKLEIYE